MLNKLKYIFFIVAILVLIVSIRQCGNMSGKYEQAKQYIESLNDSLVHLKKGVVSKPINEISEDLFKTIVKENADLKKALSDANVKLKNAKSISRIITNTEISEPVVIRLTDTIPCPEFNPIDFKEENSNYNISGSINKTSVRFNKISFPDSLYVITACKKRIFKSNEYNVLIKHSNPLIKTVGAMNLTVSDKKQLWERGWFKVGIGFVAGIITYKAVR